MCMAYLWCLLLVCFPGVLYAQSAAQSCPAPSLDGGYLVPKRETYNHGEEVTYSCDNTLKPLVEGWWARSMCRNGIWIPEPRCIDEKACLPLKIKNAKYIENSEGWYKDGDKVGIECDEGYEALNKDATDALCENGAWTSVPVCQLLADACEAPPQIPHAVVVGVKYKEVFAAQSVVQYECEDGYTVEGEESTKTITCLSGGWTDGPVCSRRPNTGRDESTVGGGGSGGQQGTQQGSSAVGGTAGGAAGGHATSTSSITPNTGGASSTGPFIPVDQCGRPPVVTNGVLIQPERMFLKYQCINMYKLEGSEDVVCLENRNWSELPLCKENFCTVVAARYSNLLGENRPGNLYIEKGDKGTHIQCSGYYQGYTALFKCTNREITYTTCCPEGYHIYPRSCPTYGHLINA